MSIPLFFREDSFLQPMELTLPDGIDVVTQRFYDVRLDDLRDIFDESFHTLAQTRPAGPPYAMYEGDPTDVFDLTIGFPVAGPVEVDDFGDIANEVFPSGPALIMSHIGGFDGLGSAWDSLLEVHKVNGGGTPRAMIEIYVNDPSTTPQEDLRTDLLALY
ncbi:GyrI-like domain-containing protein [Gordonia sp. (in: high G+C Gram-positive bacteria)]|uniref:GyrI-like domain-containing protein n=1 Tax=Gordonia sp. (in: high G+C Gram-positive bacteria) TaxID=84139 RepID=UPI003F9A192B